MIHSLCMIIQLFKNIFSYLFPPQCVVCGTEDVSENICNHCTKNFTITREFGKPWVFSLYRYRDELVTKCIHHLKNYPDTIFVQSLLQEHSRMILGWFSGIIHYHQPSRIILVPVPLHYSRFLDRGYNQAEIIMNALQEILIKKMSLPIVTKKILYKNIQTKKQALITDRSERFKNITGAFSLEKIHTIHADDVVIIIDDITTTGGTLETIRNLFPYPEKVFGFTLGH